MQTRGTAFLMATIIICSVFTGCDFRPDEGEADLPSVTATASAAPIPEPVPAAKKIGISLPARNLQCWEIDGSTMKQLLEESGYLVDLRYAGDNDVSVQVADVAEMISEGCDALIITAVEVEAFADVLIPAKNKGIPVIAYGRLISGTDVASCLVTHTQGTVSGLRIGNLQWDYIDKALASRGAEEPFNVEIFLGDVQDNPGSSYANGLMSVIRPCIDSGKIQVPSGQTEVLQVATQNWRIEKARERMESLIASQNYSPDGKKLDAVWCANDFLAQGVTQALLGAGYTAEDFPIITGGDCDVGSVKNIINGTQSMSVFYDTRTMAARAAGIVSSVLNGEELEAGDDLTDNGTGEIPMYYGDYAVCTKDNYRELLIDSGYYTEEELSG